MNTNRRRYGKWLAPIAVAIIAFVAFNVLCVSSLYANAAQPGTASLQANRFFTVDGIEGLDELRKSYFSTSSVTTSTATQTTTSYEGDRWAIVEFDDPSLYEYFEKSGYSNFSEYCSTDAADKIRNNLVSNHNAFLALLDENSIEYQYKYSYTTLNNGIAIKVSSAAYNTISKMSEIKTIYMSEQYAAPQVATVNDANVYTTGIYDSSDIDYKGEGMVVAVLDTGLDHTHEAFTTMPSNKDLLWTIDDIREKMSNSKIFNAKATAEEVYYNEKIPFAYDYADDDADVYPSYSTHGTHVAGIVAGKSDYVVNPSTGETFIGVAPEAQLVICKVFTDNLDSEDLGGANTMDIIAAVSDCAELGVDVINMSLGSSAGFADEKSDDAVNEVYERVKAAGISLVVAASNDYSSGFGGANGTNLATNPDSATVGSPSTYDAALSVASINGQKATYIQANNDEDQVAFITTSSDENGNEYKFTELLYELAGKKSTETLNFKYVVIGGVGRATNYNAAVKREIKNKSGYDGVIVLVKRGDTTFAEKVQTAMDNGADACIIYNNVSGTIRMSLGDVENPIPTCSISMDAGKIFVDNAVKNVGSVQISNDFMAGPFMSEFSSWGPMPDLQLKPEITAHGGEITSAVPGGYDIYSGTSMAAPNMAGAVALLRQYIKQTSGLDGVELTARVNQVLMSTATIANNEEGNPYSPRKQGAGLAGIANAIKTESYITVLDEDGNAKDKTKIELYDDKNRVGKYTLEFVINNISGKTETYMPKTYVMTETLASDNKTVAEKAYMLDDTTIKYYVGGQLHDGEITVPAGATLAVKVELELSAAARKYIDSCFSNGMYVEGFVSLVATGETEVTIGLPYLAFYGDWDDGPLFDYDTYEIAESEKDTGVPEEDKLKASAAETRVLGRYYDDEYIISIGAYLYSMDDSDVQIYPSREKAALSMFDYENNRTVYELYMVYAGLLRNAAYMTIEVTDSVTGDILYTDRQENISKSYASGGSNHGSPILMDLNPYEWGLTSNSTYYVTLKGELEGVYGEERNEKVTNPERNSFNFQFTVDYEAPQLLDYRIRYDSYKDENKQTKYKIYLDADVFDNQYVMSVLPCYVKENKGKSELTLATQYPVPVYGNKGETSTISFEITDIFEDYVKTGKLYLVLEDYAMNQTAYIINLQTGSAYPESVKLGTDEKLVNTGDVNKNSDGSTYEVYELTISPNEVYKPSIAVTPADIASRSLTYYVKSGNNYVKVNEEEIFGVANGRATVYLCDVESGEDQTIFAQIDVTVQGAAKSLPRLNKISLLPAANGNDYVMSLEGTLPEFDMYPNQSVQFNVKVDPWYLSNIEYKWESKNTEVATVDEVGIVTTHKKGRAIITVSVVGNATASKSIKVTVADEYRISGNVLYDYYGGENVEIPENKNIMGLDEECFQNNTTIKRVVIPSTLTQIPENAFVGCTALEEIVIPSQCIVIGRGAFKGCTALKKITFGKFVDAEKVEHPEYAGAITIGPEAFAGCTSLTTIENSLRLTTLGDRAFADCTALSTIDLSALRVTGKNVFGGCVALETVVTDEHTNIGEGMFSGCTSLTSFTFAGDYLNANVFAGCTALAEIVFSSESFTGIGKYALSNTTMLESVTLPAGKYTIGAGAFNGSGIKTITLADGAEISFSTSTPFSGCDKFSAYIVSDSNSLYTVESGVLYNKDKTALVSVPCGHTEVTLPETVVEIGAGAMSGFGSLTTFDASGVSKVGEYAFAGCSKLQEVTFASDIKVLPEGVFSGCKKLETVNGIENVTEVGSYAFRNCEKLTEISLPKLQVIGDSAFESTALLELSAPEVVEIGAAAFKGSNALEELEFASATTIGSEAFAQMKNLRVVALGGVTEMGASVFYNSANLQEVTFGEGTTVIGEYAFTTATPGGMKSLTAVVLPDSVESIGMGAFYNTPNLTEINLSGVKNIGYMSFYCSGIAVASLANAEYIDDYAFAGAKLTTADLTSAIQIGNYAFTQVPLTQVSFGALKILGMGSFMETELTTVTLPAGFERSYVYEWDEIDEKGRVEKERERNIGSYGAGAFSYIDTLTEILVADGNENYRSIDGVLYSVVKQVADGATVEKGLVLEQYPTAKAGTSYTVVDNTIAIADSAFEGVAVLEKITFPYTVKSIGSYAFFDSTVADYTFNSVAAPALIADYVDAYTLTDDYLFMMFADEDGYLGGSHYYANFYDYVARRLYADWFINYTTPSFNLTLTVPKNGTGYDTVIWTNYFETINVTEEILPDDTTHDALKAMSAYKEVMTDAEISAATDIASLEEISAAVKAARLAYNKITTSEQINLVATEYEALLNTEKALRDKKAALGQPVAVSNIELAKRPDKIRYTEGESFDMTGMIIKVVYADTSEVLVTDVTTDKTVLSYGDEYVVVTYTERGQGYSVRVNVNVAAKDSGADDVIQPDTDKKDGLSTGAIVGISVACGVVVLAGAAVAVILVLRKKKPDLFVGKGKKNKEEDVLPIDDDNN